MNAEKAREGKKDGGKKCIRATARSNGSSSAHM